MGFVGRSRKLAVRVLVHLFAGAVAGAFVWGAVDFVLDQFGAAPSNDQMVLGGFIVIGAILALLLDALGRGIPTDDNPLEGS